MFVIEVLKIYSAPVGDVSVLLTIDEARSRCLDHVRGVRRLASADLRLQYIFPIKPTVSLDLNHVKPLESDSYQLDSFLWW